jgi:Protein of unknown function (DUF5672)
MNLNINLFFITKQMSNKYHNIKIIENYLLAQCNILNLYYNKYPKKWNKKSNHCAVIIEPRNHHLLEAVCKNVMYFLPEHWNLIICSYNEEWVRKQIQNIEFQFIKLDKNSLSLEEYSNVLMSSIFWNKIPAENILIFQTDSYMTRRMTKEYLEEIEKYSMIGAPFRYINYSNGKDDNIDRASVDTERNFSMSGGFSFRKKSAMLDCIQHITLNDIHQYRIKNKMYMDMKNIYYEDFYFEHALYLLHYPFPSYSLCREWCHQALYELVNSYAIHGINHSYVYDHLIYCLRPSLAEIHDEIIQK